MKNSSLAFLLFSAISVGCITKSEPAPTGGGTSSEESAPSTPDEEGASSGANKSSSGGKTSGSNGVSCKIDSDCAPWHCTCSTAGGDQFQQLVSICQNGACAEAKVACDPPGKNICGAGAYWTGWAYGGPDGK